MNAITRTVTLDDLTPEELAQIFAHMDSGKQAEFFNAVACEVWGWPGLGWCGQCAYIIDDLNAEGARVVLTLAGHIEDKAARDSGSRPEGENAERSGAVEGEARQSGDSEAGASPNPLPLPPPKDLHNEQ